MKTVFHRIGGRFVDLAIMKSIEPTKINPEGNVIIVKKQNLKLSSEAILKTDVLSAVTTSKEYISTNYALC